MFSFNNYDRRTVIGRLTRDPEVKQIGEKKTNKLVFSIAVSKYNPETKKSDKSEYIECNSFNETLVKLVPQYAHKGTEVYVYGEPSTREYTDKEGAKRTVHELSVMDFIKLGSDKDKAQTAGNGEATAAAAPAATAAPVARDEYDDIAF